MPGQPRIDYWRRTRDFFRVTTLTLSACFFTAITGVVLGLFLFVRHWLMKELVLVAMILAMLWICSFSLWLLIVLVRYMKYQFSLQSMMLFVFGTGLGIALVRSGSAFGAYLGIVVLSIVAMAILCWIASFDPNIYDPEESQSNIPEFIADG